MSPSASQGKTKSQSIAAFFPMVEATCLWFRSTAGHTHPSERGRVNPYENEFDPVIFCD
jgi:hypothetical protein